MGSEKLIFFIIEDTLVLRKDERLGNGEVSSSEPVLSSSTIAAIVTSLGGPPGAVGIVRLSGPSAVSIAGRVFQPKLRKRRKGFLWSPKSHVVEYGVVLDSNCNVIDEVLIVCLFLSLVCIINTGVSKLFADR